jgi:hypothetical protein
MDSHCCSPLVLRVFSSQFSQSRNAAIAFQHSVIDRNQRLLKTSVIAGNGIQQRLEFWQCLKRLKNLGLARPVGPQRA